MNGNNCICQDAIIVITLLDTNAFNNTVYF